MANTYSQIYIQIVFAVKGRNNFIQYAWEEELYKYITAVVQNDKYKMIAINGMPDHIHAFIGLRPAMPVADIVRDIKNNSSNFINDHKFVKGKFAWQEGYGAFSYAKSQVADVVRYIQNQEIHHQKETFLDEYRKFLTAFEIEWREKYIFKDPE